MKAADEGEEGRPTHPSIVAGRDLCGGSPGAAQVSVLVRLRAPFLTPRLRAGSQLPGGVQEGGTTDKVGPILWGCWAVTGGTRPCPDARGGTNPLFVLLPPNLPKSPRSVAGGDGKPRPQARLRQKPSWQLSPSMGQSITPGLPSTEPRGWSPHSRGATMPGQG